MTPIAIDIAHFDPVNSFVQVQAAGIRAVIHKATEGSGITDSMYAHRRQFFVDLGFKWGAYHFFHGDPREADHFLEVAEPDDDTVMALDWETTPGGYTPSEPRARQFIERLESKLGRPAVVYSGNVAKEQIVGAHPFWGQRRLWLAQYSASWKVQQSWARPWLWQYGSEITHARVPGIGSYCDVNTIDTLGVDPAEFIATWVPRDEVANMPAPEPHTQVGKASWYADGRNASGAPVNNETDMTAAHKTLPFGTKVLVTRADTGQNVLVTITDRGPYEPGRIIDLRPAAARELDMIERGVVPVTITKVLA